mgnify:CR=1 FL=1
MKILLIEDDIEISEMLCSYLIAENFEVVCATDGQKACEAFDIGSYSIVLLDLMIPKITGMNVMKYIRQKSTVPIIIISAKDSDSDKTLGLGLGADDYIGKPFRPRELVSRIRSVLRRCGKAHNIIELGDVTIDTAGGTVRKDGQELFLSALEYRLLLVFANHKGNVLSRNQLLEEIWDVAGEFVNDNTLTVYIKRLREKIETDAANPTIIKTVRGLGYRAE